MDFCSFQVFTQCEMIFFRLWRARSDLVGSSCFGMQGWWVAALASLSTFSFPWMPIWLGIHMNDILILLEDAVIRRVWMRATIGLSE